jgi:hypothetical protein
VEEVLEWQVVEGVDLKILSLSDSVYRVLGKLELKEILTFTAELFDQKIIIYQTFSICYYLTQLQRYLRYLHFYGLILYPESKLDQSSFIIDTILILI